MRSRRFVFGDPYPPLARADQAEDPCLPGRAPVLGVAAILRENRDVSDGLSTRIRHGLSAPPGTAAIGGC